MVENDIVMGNTEEEKEEKEEQEEQEEEEEKEEKEVFMEVEKEFRDIMERKYVAINEPLTHQNICCDEEIAAQYIIFGYQLLEAQRGKKHQLSLKDIYRVLVYTDYILGGNDAHGWWLKTKDLRKLFGDRNKDFELAINLYLHITTGNALVMSDIRRFALKMLGGRKKRKGKVGTKKRKKTQKKRKTRRKRRKKRTKRTKRTKKRNRKRRKN